MGGPHRMGGGVPEKTAQFRSCPSSTYPCQRVPAPDKPAGSTKFSRRGWSRKARKKEVPLAPDSKAGLSPNTPKPADGGNCDYTQTRTDARTLDATSPGACAKARKPCPSIIRSASHRAQPLTRAAPPLLCTHAHSLPTLNLPPFSSRSTCLSMRNSRPS